MNSLKTNQAATDDAIILKRCYVIEKMLLLHLNKSHGHQIERTWSVGDKVWRLMDNGGPGDELF